MNYYNYYDELNSIIGLLDDMLRSDETQHSELMTEIRQIHTDNNTKLDTINTTLTTINTTITNGITLISALIVLGAAMKVIFK